MEEETKEVINDTVEENNGPIVEPAEIEKTSKKKNGKKQRKDLTPEQKKKKRVKSLIITAAVVVVLAIFFSSCAIANTTGMTKLINISNAFEKVEYENQLVPVLDKDEYYTFTTNRDFKVMQITDVHIGGGCFSEQKDEWALKAVANMISQEKPDLVIVTGDIAYPVPFQAGTFNNLNATKIFATMMEKLGVYWTFTFGNHDTEAYSMYSREDICKYYESSYYKYCLFQRGFSSEERGYGNTIIKVKNTAGIVTQALVLLDTHSYVDGDNFGILAKYDNIHQSQVDWYVGEMKQIASANKEINMSGPDTVKNIAFLHIPTDEFRTAWVEYKNNGKQDTEDVKYCYGFIGEKEVVKNNIQTYGILSGLYKDNLFEAGSLNGLQAIFCGHDHLNNLSVYYKGIRLTYGMSIDYLAYSGIHKQHEQRGATIIKTNIDTTIDIQAKNYYTDYNIPYEIE